MKECTCDLRTRVVGDGCEICNPEKALEYAKETIADLERELAAWKEAMRRARIERERHAGPGGVLNWIEGEVANILAANA